LESSIGKEKNKNNIMGSIEVTAVLLKSTIEFRVYHPSCGGDGTGRRLGIGRTGAFASVRGLRFLGPEDDGGFVRAFKSDPAVHDLQYAALSVGIDPKGGLGPGEEKVRFAQRCDLSISSAPAEKSFPCDVRYLKVYMA
jgi:hypothetical protein